MICKCPICGEYCSGTKNSISSAGINTMNKITDGIEDLKNQVKSSSPLIQGIGKAIINSASTMLNWDTYYKFECGACGNKWAKKESEVVDETEQYYLARENFFVKQSGGRILTINPDANCVYSRLLNHIIESNS